MKLFYLAVRDACRAGVRAGNDWRIVLGSGLGKSRWDGTRGGNPPARTPGREDDLEYLYDKGQKAGSI